MSKEVCGRDVFNWGGFNHRAAECAERKKAQTLKVAGVEIEEVGTPECSKKSGRD
jgi:hypothetical protein